MNSIDSAKPSPQVRDQVDDLRLDRHVERRDRLVGDQQLRRQRERAGDGDALALAAGEFVRIARRRRRPAGRPAPSSSATRSAHVRLAVDDQRLADERRAPCGAD